MVLRIFKMIATSGFLAALECTRFVFSRGSAPDTTEGAYSSQDPLAGLRGPISKREAEVEGEGKGRKEGERKGKGGTSHFQIPGSAPGYCGNRGSGTSLH